jgi:hypothetical protein
MFIRRIALITLLVLIGSEAAVLGQRRGGGFRPPPPPPIRGGGVGGGGGAARPARPPGVPARPRTGAPTQRRPGQPGTAARGGAAGRGGAGSTGSSSRVVVPSPKSPEVAQARAAAKPRLDRLRERFNAKSTARTGAVAAKPPAGDEPRNQQERALLQAARDRELKGLNKSVGPRAPLAEAQRIASQHGGQPGDWMKMSGGTTTITATGQRVEVHYYKNVATGKVVGWTFTRQEAAPLPKP